MRQTQDCGLKVLYAEGERNLMRVADLSAGSMGNSIDGRKVMGAWPLAVTEVLVKTLSFNAACNRRE